ncbi:hypothetical protein [Methylorubrum aminovorans]
MCPTDSNPTAGELVKASAFPIADGYVVDLDAAIAEHFEASLLVVNEDASTDQMRGTDRTAILVARAQKG